MARILLQWRQRNTSATADSLYQPKRPRQEKALITCWLCQVSQGGVNRSAIAHPKQHGVFQAFWRSHLPDFTTLHQGIVLWSFHGMFHVSEKPTSFVGISPEFPPKKNIAGLRNCCGCWGLPPLLPPHWKPKALAPLDCSPRQLMAGRHGEIIWKSTIFQLGSKKTTCWKFSVKSQISSMFGYSTKTVKLLGWSLYAEIKVALEMTPPPAKSHVQFSWASPRRMLQESPSGEVSYIFSMGTTRSQGNIERMRQKDK